MADCMQLPYPPPVTITGLQNHFRSTYQLGDEQVVLMINSSRKSLDKILAEARQALQADDICAELVNIGHSLKGLLLNMGEPEWAEVARALEKSARDRDILDYDAIIRQMTVGMAIVLAYDDAA